MTNSEALIDFSDTHTANINCDMYKYLFHLRHLVQHVPQSHYINDRLQAIFGRQFKEMFSSFLVSTNNTD